MYAFHYCTCLLMISIEFNRCWATTWIIYHGRKKSKIFYDVNEFYTKNSIKKKKGISNDETDMN